MAKRTFNLRKFQAIARVLLLAMNLSAATLFGACSTLSLKSSPAIFSAPPALSKTLAADAPQAEIQLEGQLESSKTEAMQLLVRYKEAQLWTDINPAKSCRLWLEISAQERFPLAHVARLRAFEVCPKDEKRLPTLDAFVETTTESWLHDDLLRVALKRAQVTADQRWEMQLSFDYGRKQAQQSEQIRLLKRANELALLLNDAEFAAKAQLELLAAAPRFIVEPKPEELLKVAADFRRARDFELSRQFYQKFLVQSDASPLEQLKALDGIRQTYKLQNDKEKFLRATRDYARFAKRKFFLEGRKDPSLFQPQRHLDAQLTLARAVWTENSPSEAADILKRVEYELRGKAPLDESRFIRARIEEEAGRYNQSISILSNIDSAKVASRELRTKILWYRAWNLRRLEHWPQAIEAFEQLAQEENPPSTLARVQFWLARSLRDSGDEVRALEKFEQLIVDDPLGYYGLLAYRELKRPLPPLNRESKPAVATDDSSSEPAVSEQFFSTQEDNLFQWLIATSENDLGGRFLEQLMRTKPPQSSRLLQALKAYARAGKYQGLFGHIQELTPEARKSILDQEPSLIFPQPWQETVALNAQRFDVPLELVYSIIRQESSFDPMARSSADAFGLMQLVPEMAERARASTKIELGSAEELYKPEKNIVLGTAFLRGLLNEWQGHFIPVIASYNASQKSVSGWLKSRARRDPLEFIEDVPYEETRTYLKLVLRNFVFYSRLNSGGLPLAFPEHCLDGIQGDKP